MLSNSTHTKLPKKDDRPVLFCHLLSQLLWRMTKYSIVSAWSRYLKPSLDYAHIFTSPLINDIF
jgi:hypothetical protein